MGDGRFNMGHSLLVMGAIMGADVRICAPKDLWPDKDVQDAAHERAAVSGARITLTDDPAEGLSGVDFVHTDVWVSMGEPKDVWDQRVADLLPRTRSTRTRWSAPATRTRSSCTACRRSTTRDTVVGAQIAEKTGMTGGLEVTDEVFESAANIAFDQAENRLHTIKAIMVATLG